jgi:hypothetical protein
MTETVHDTGMVNIDSKEVIYHLVSGTDVLQKYLETSSSKFDFDSFVDFANDHIKNEGEVVESYEAVGAYDDTFLSQPSVL